MSDHAARRGRVGALGALALLLLISGCAAPAARTAVSEAAKTTSPPVSMPATSAPGTGFRSERISGSGFDAQFTLARGLPGRSGESTIEVIVSIMPDGRYLKNDGLSLYTPDAPTLELSAVTPTATLTLAGGGGRFGSGRSTGDYVLGEFGGRFFPLPPSATSLRATVHMGVSPQAAQVGTSVVIPVSAIPVLDSLDTLPQGYRHGGLGTL